MNYITVILLLLIIIYNISYNYYHEPFNINKYYKKKEKKKQIKMSKKKFKDELIKILDRTPDPGKNVVDYYVNKYYHNCKGNNAYKNYGCTNLINNMYNSYGYSFKNELI